MWVSFGAGGPDILATTKKGGSLTPGVSVLTAFKGTERLVLMAELLDLKRQWLSKPLMFAAGGLDPYLLGPHGEGVREVVSWLHRWSLNLRGPQGPSFQG